MNTMIALSRSTVLADVSLRRRHPSPSTPSVRVGGITLGSRTMVGNAAHYLNRAYSPLGVRVGATGTAANAAATPAPAPAEETDTAPAKSGSMLSPLGKVAGWTLLASMVAGPPAVGYLIGGKVGLAVGAVVAAPMVIMFTMALIGTSTGKYL